MPSGHFMRAACAALMATAFAASASAQETFRVFLRGVEAGTDQIALARAPEGWTITASGQIGPPLQVVTRRLEIRYDPDWKPLALSIDGTARGQVVSVRVAVEGTTATTHIFNAGQTLDKTDTIAADAVLLPPAPYFAGYLAVAERLKDAAPNTAIHAYVPGQGSLDLTVGSSTSERIQTVSGLVVARRTTLTLAIPNMPLDAEVWGDQNGRLLRFTLPVQGVDVVRDDLASVSSRRVTISRPNDEAVKFGSNGVTLAGTLSRPASAAAARLPAVVLVGGIGPQDRDEERFGIPILGQIADAIANAGFIVLRYDKRGVGQSGGRVESTSIQDLAEDLRAAVKYLADRKDVDAKHIAVVGYAEGGTVAMVAAEKDKRIDAVALLDTNGATGADAVLAQQQHVLDRTQLSPEQKQQRIELQKKINELAVTGKGLDQLPENVRRQVDNPEFLSWLAADPAKIVPKLKQPILIVVGDRDTFFDPSNADRLEALAKGRKNAPPPTLVKVPGVNHLLVPAATGEADEYASLRDKHVSAAVTDALVNWLKKTVADR